jgi:hypothetical protein
MFSTRRTDEATSALSQIAPVNTAAASAIIPEAAKIVSLLMTTPVPAPGPTHTPFPSTPLRVTRVRGTRPDCSLKKSPAPSSSELIAEHVFDHLRKHDVS